MVFDAGIEEGAEAAPVRRRQESAGAHRTKREGGVIWHTQGSGKSIVMVLLAKWILERDPDGRVLVVTDRDELDKQIEGVMKNAGVVSARTRRPRASRNAGAVRREAWRDHAAPAVRADPQVRSRPTSRASRPQSRAASMCSSTNATAHRAAT